MPSSTRKAKMTRKYFGTDGIRGTVGQYPITPDFVLRLAHAVGRVLRRTEERPTVLIGKDTVFLATCWKVLWSLDSTPLAWTSCCWAVADPWSCLLDACAALRAWGGHQCQPQRLSDNGIKVLQCPGHQVARRLGAGCRGCAGWGRLLGRFFQPGQGAPTGRCSRAIYRVLQKHVSSRPHPEGSQIVVDAAHGAAYQVAPKVFPRVGCRGDLHRLCTRWRTSTTRSVTHPDALVRSVRANHADYGVALDGDADRLQMVDATGRLYNGDELLYLMAADRMGRDEHVPGLSVH